MGEHLRYLAQHARTPLSCLPNAGLPELRDGRPWYPLTPAELAEAHDRFVAEFGLNVVGGCCGTTPEHIRQVVEAISGRAPAAREPIHEPSLASLYQSVPLDQDLTYLTVGERCNANGSRKFRDLMLDGDLEGMVGVAKEQIREGAHVLDVCVDYVGRDGVPDMDVLAARLAQQSTVPIMLDSTQADVIEAGLKRLGGRAIINSINLEDGENRMDAVCPMARQYGAALVALLIDEEGQARDVEWKLRIAHRIHDLAVDKHGLQPGDLVFDALTFPLGSGQEDLRGDAIATLEAIRRIKAELPGVRTILGVSNVSFGLSPAARQVLNSVFLHEAREAGLDAAIVSPARILPMHRIEEEQRQVALDLIYDRRRDGYDPLQRFMALFEGKEATKAASAEDLTALPIDERLQRRIVDGVREGLEADLQEAMTTRDPLAFTFPRQRRDRPLCIADFFRPVDSGERDVVGFHVVTMGRAASEATARLFADNRYREYLELHGVTVEMAEALAELWHKRIREELGIAGDDAADMKDLFDQGYRGSRYSFGYPACPDLEEQTKIFQLLRPERIGVELSEEYQLHPEQSTSAIIVHHPEAVYFNAR